MLVTPQLFAYLFLPSRSSLRTLFVALYLLQVVMVIGQSRAQFIENKGQWPQKVDYKLELTSGDIYFEGDEITFCLYNKGQYGDFRHGRTTDSLLKGHVYKVNFLGALDTYQPYGEEQSTNYYNYFIGNDPSNWASDVFAYSKIGVRNLYEGIDLVFYKSYEQLKYDFLIHPGSDASRIHLAYTGVSRTYLKNDHMIIETNVGQVIEQSPYAYQYVNGVEKKVACNYVLNDNVLSFDFPNGYDTQLELIIDPVLTFSTFTGSSASNFGCTATYDVAGNLYSGGTVFGVGYPTTTGAFQQFFSGGTIDMGITKFSSNGTNLIYSTYIGGTDAEIPHSLVVNAQNELLILGTTGSSNYPTIAGSYDVTYNGGPALNLGAGYGFSYNFGCDIVVTKLAAGGNALLASTFVGGSENDGINFGSILRYNYGDAFRGEIIVDENDNVFVASVTRSTNFPITAGAPQSTFGGGLSDGCVFKLNSNLSNLLFSTYLGGSNTDAAYSVQLNSLGDVYVAGGTISTNFPTQSGGLNTAYQGGTADGFVTRINASGTAFLNSTYIGNSGYNQCYFVQTNLANEVFVIGQTTGSYPISPGTYNNPNSGQFIHKLSTNLTTSLASTTIGRGTGQVDISLTAFLVSDCDFIYLSGWGGPLNGNSGLGVHATQSSTTGLPTFGSPFQSTTDGQDFYIMVLAPDMSGLLYATYFGGNMSAEHADGGTSRFDKAGKMYQAVCAGCGGNSDFPTTPGAWSNVNNSSNCNLGAFKFDLGSIVPSISLPQPFVCIPSSYQFNNNSVGANSYFWDFGDGNTSTAFAPSHTYQTPGDYQVTLIAADSLNCIQSDTAFIDISVFEVDDASVLTIDTICPNSSVQLTASGGTTYQWIPADYLSNPNIPNPICTPPVTTPYMVLATDLCGTDTAYALVIVYEEEVGAMPDTAICIGNSIELVAFGGVQYSWYPDAFMTNASSNTPTVTPSLSLMYFVDITTAIGCVYTDTVQVTIETTFPIPVMSPDATICLGDSVSLNASGGTSIAWTPANIIADPFAFNTQALPLENTMFYAFLMNSCGGVMDSTFVTVVQVYPSIVPDTTICPGDTAILWAAGGSFYTWTPAETLSHPDSSTTLAMPTVQTTYLATVGNDLGCTAQLSTTVSIYSPPFVDAGADVYANFGVPVMLNGSTQSNVYYWESVDSLSCVGCLRPTVKPYQSTDYILFVTDENGCLNSDTVRVILDGALYVPNAFTPNGDGINDVFVIRGVDIKDFELFIFDRWGLLIYETNNMDEYWDGTYKGDPVQLDTYVWKVNYSDYQRNKHNLVGHVSVIR
jgi:gliding motility-associated-like protein